MNITSTLILYSILLLLTSCSNVEQNGSTNEKTENHSRIDTSTEDFSTHSDQGVTLDEFLGHFDLSSDFSSWPKEITHPFYYESPVFNPKYDFFTYPDSLKRDAFLHQYFSLLDNRYYKFIPVTTIVNLGSSELGEKAFQTPRKSFDFWAAKRMRTDAYWLISVQAVKKTWVHNEFNGHPLLLVTYSPEGKILDSFVWIIFYDDGAGGGTMVEVYGDTLVLGSKNEFDDPRFWSIYSKTIITPEGKFITVYKEAQ